MNTVKWSFSGLKDFINCPRQYYEVKVAQNFVKKVTEKMLYGTEVHKALEDYARDGTKLPLFYERYKPLLDTLLTIPGKRYLEYKMALTKDKKPCDFDAPDYWVRGIVDFMVIDDGTAYIVDYKTGSNKYPDMKQLKLMALMTFAHFPEVKHVKAGLLFVAHDNFMPEEYTIEQSEQMWGVFAPDIARLEHSFKSSTWPPNPTPLCGWCPVVSCEFHKE